MESRHCDGCGKIFRVSVISGQKYHSELCRMSGSVWSGRKFQRSESERRIATVNVPNIGAMKNIETPKELIVKNIPLPQSTLKIVEPSAENVKENNVKNDERKSMNTNVETTTPIGPLTAQNNLPTETKGSQTDQLEELRSSIVKGVSHTMNLLDESSALLLEQMKSLLKSTDHKNPGFSEIELARMNADTIARLVQAKVNTIRAMNK